MSICGIVSIAEQLLERASAELDDQTNLQKKLLTLQLAFDLGDIYEQELEIQEEELLLNLQALDAENEEEADLQF